MENLMGAEERVPTSRRVESAESRSGSRAWLFGAYTFLVLWGMAFLVLYFTDRLPL